MDKIVSYHLSVTSYQLLKTENCKLKIAFPEEIDNG